MKLRRSFDSVESFEAHIRRALQEKLPYTDPRIPRAGGTPAAVLILFGFHDGDLGKTPGSGQVEPSVLVIRRTDTVKTHKGQMAFPGGGAELVDRDRYHTALRETEEEVGISAEDVQVIGELPKFATITEFDVTPVVGILRPSIEETRIRMNTDEIAETSWIPLSILQAEGTYHSETIAYGQVHYPIHVYQVGSYRIWGVTASMLKNLLDRFNRV